MPSNVLRPQALSAPPTVFIEFDFKVFLNVT